MKIVADANIPFVKEAFSEFGEVEVVSGRSIGRETIADASMLLVRSVTPVNRELLEGSPVKFVASATTGIDHIDTAFLSDSNIGFAYAPGANANSVAEYVIAAIVLFAEKNSIDLKGKTLGIIGVGNVGGRLFSLANAIGLRCLLNDPPKKKLTKSDFYIDLDTLLAQADILTLHVPLVKSGENPTFHMANDAFFSKVKKGTLFINSSRGGVVDEAALRANRKRLGGLVLDVWENEPGISLETLKMADFATPHIAGYSYDGKLRGTNMVYEAACAFYFKSKTWLMEKCIQEGAAQSLDLRKCPDPLAQAVVRSCPVVEDDERLREALEINDDKKRADYFDGLRNSYPKRLEFSHFSLQCSAETPPETIEVFKGLGFRMGMSC
jgi:erythronate-4-phosphate dehydrogenase